METRVTEINDGAANPDSDFVDWFEATDWTWGITEEDQRRLRSGVSALVENARVVGHPSDGERRPVPQGVVGLVEAPGGMVVTEAVDFDEFSPGGFSKQEMQRIRVVDKLHMAFAREQLGEMLSGKLNIAFARRLFEQAEANGYSIRTIAVGYDGG
jgi:hypothetical protein